MIETLQVDDLQFELRRSSKRQTVGFTVDRDGSLIVHAPENCAVSTIERLARDKRLWIHTTLATKEVSGNTPQPKEYVAGEGFYYLGRNHRLRLIDDAAVHPLRLYRGRFELDRQEVDQGRSHFIQWYRSNGKAWIEGRLDRWISRVGAQPQGVSIRSLGNRWGSCTRDGRLLLHWRTVLLPPLMIDYLLVHELAHLHESTHSPAFWQRVERTLPDYSHRKQWLAANGANYDL